MASDAPGQGPRGNGPHPDDFDARLKRARGDERPAAGPGPSLLGLAFRLATELVAGVAVGFLIGWLLDRWLGTAPWLTLAFFALGVAAGFTNVVRTARQMNVQSGAGTPAPPLDEDNED
jgi:ATP synthase protein I